MAVIDLSWGSATQGCAVAAVMLLLWRLTRPSNPPLPPGPSPVPILGNLGMPQDYRKAFGEWAEKYGEIVNMRVFGKNVILLNSKRVVTELLEGRSASSFARQKLVMAHDLVGLKYMVSQVSDHALHREYRRIYATVFNARAAQAFWEMQDHQLRKLALWLLESTDDYPEDINKSSTAIAFLIAYGKDLEKDNPQLSAKIKQFMLVFLSLIQPGAFLVDVIPALQKLPTWFPGTGWRKQAEQWRKASEYVIGTPYEAVKKDLATGNATPSFTAALLLGGEGKKPTEERTVMWAAGGIFNAGSDTTAAAIHNFLYAMCLNPSVQQQAQVELDAVIGRDQLPSLSDRERLPYCWGVMLEALRWENVAPLALPHVMVQDEILDGYLIPKGTTVLPNVWLLARDPVEFPNPDAFQPERWMSKDGKSSSEIEQGRGAAFGFGYGRRVCPGEHIAENSLFAAVVSILWASVVSSPEGHNIDPMWSKKPSVRRPGKFPIEIKPRFPGAMDMLRNAVVE